MPVAKGFVKAFLLTAFTLKLSALLGFTQELRFGLLVQLLSAFMGCSNIPIIYTYIYYIYLYNILCESPWVKAASAQDQHIIIRPAEEVISAMLHPEDSRSTVVRNKSSSMWCQSAYNGHNHNPTGLLT